MCCCPQTLAVHTLVTCVICWYAGYRPQLQAQLERSVSANLQALQAEREALLQDTKAKPAEAK